MKSHSTILLLLSARLAAQTITDSAINQAVDRIAPTMIELRHHVHQHPELSNREFTTSKLVVTQVVLKYLNTP